MLFNTARAVEYMHRCGLDALVATSPVNITYLTDYACWFDPLFREYMMVPGAPSNRSQSYAVFPREGEAAFVVSIPLFAVNAADLWVRDLSIYGSPGVDTSLPPTALSDTYRRFFDLLTASSHHPTALDALVSVLRARGLTGARIGLEMEGLALASHEAIARALPRADIKDCSNLIRLLRMVKTADELARLTRAAEISEQAAMESLALARPGRPMAELSQHYRARVSEQGAAFDHFAFGVNGLGIATEPEYVPVQGDVEYVDFGCIYRQGFSDSGTTLATGEPSPVLRDRFAALRTCLDAAISIMRPGVKASAVQAPMQATLKAYGLTGSFPHGHGVGLEVRDYPIIVPDNGLRIRDDCIDVPSDLTLEADMVINLEAPLFMPGVGSLHIEQSFVITPNGCRPLVSQDRGRIVTSDENGCFNPQSAIRNRPHQSHPTLSGLRVTMMGIVVNTLLAGTKAIAGILGHSHALVADAIESTADIIGSLIVFSGLKIAALPPDVDHPYGHGKAEPLTAFVVALTLGVAAVGIAIQSLRGILVPHQAPAPFTLIVLVVVVAIKEGLFRVVSRVGESMASTALKTDAWHHRSDAITSAAAFLGISVALIGGRGYESADDWAALFASFIIAYNAYRLLRPAVSEVMDAAPPASVEISVRSAASAVDEVTGLEKCLIRKVGVEYYVDLHVLVDGNISVRHGHEVAHRVKDAIRAAHPQVTDVMVHIEPAKTIE